VCLLICLYGFSAQRGLAIACRLSVCPSVTFVDCDHIGWNSSEIILPGMFALCRPKHQGEHPKISAQSDPPPVA